VAKALRIVVSLLGLALGTVSALVLLGQLSCVTTHGVSMEPRFHTGDLAVLRTTDGYRVGDVAGYRSTLLDTVVLHRITAVHDGRYTFQGDNNSWTDPERPPRSALVGTLALRIPQGGTWLARLSSPRGLGALAAVAVALGGTATTRTLRRRTRRRTMAQHAHRSPLARALAGLPPWARTLAGLASMAALVGLVLAVPAWALSPTRQQTSTRTQVQTMTFSYATRVPRSPAYDGTTVHSPDPVFRRLTGTLDVTWSFVGRPPQVGRTTLELRLSTPGGWHATVRGGQVRRTPSGGSVRLDLAALEARAAAAAAATGLPAAPLTVTVAPSVHVTGRPVFTPELALTLSPLTVALAGGPSSLLVNDTTSARTTAAVPRVLSLAGHRLTTGWARDVSSGLLLAAALVTLLLWFVGRPGASASEGAAIRRRWAPILVQVQPLPNPPGRPVVDVVDFATLAKLAERYGLLVMHWSRSDVETFVVHDEGTTYRYRTAAPRSVELVEAAAV